MKKRRIVSLSSICLLCLGTFSKSLAQDSANTINKISISSPTAASLGKYGDYAVNYNSGVPNISIPLYTLKSKDLSMPISLSYHASGLKVQEAAGWVGAGWSLNAGGVITRSVVGTPDDGALAGTSVFLKGHYKDNGFNNYLWVAGSGYGSTSDGKRADDGSFLNGYNDGEPDMFSFNVGGTSGKFYFNDDRTAVLVPEQDVKIQPDFSVGNGFTGFVLSISTGTKYYFGKSGNNGAVDPIEMTIPMTFEDGAAFQQKANSSWYLNKIVSVDGMDSILLNYVTESYSHYTLSMFPVSFRQKSIIGGTARYGYNLVKNLVSGVRLNQIISLSGTITFGASALRTDLAAGWPTTIGDQPNSTAYSLGNIQIDNNDGFCKKFVFKYGYFYDNTTSLQGPVLTNSAFSTIQTDRYKLRLDTLQEMSCDAAVQVPAYTFSYYSEKVPRILSLGLDHWGFYNGVASNTGLIPTHIVKYQGLITQRPGANRDAVFPAMRGGTLQKIVYPTGGFTTFDFEANTTYVNYNTYSFVQRLTMSAGYDGHNGYLGDGGSNPLENAYVFSGNQYDLLVTNTDNANVTNEGAYVLIYNSTRSSTVFSSGTINAGEQKTFTLQLPYGTYYVQLAKNNASTSHGAYLAFTEKVPTPVAANATVGGLRIKTLTTNNGVNSNNIVTSYSYNAGTQSSGILYSKPSYVKLVKNISFNKVYATGLNWNCNVLVAAGVPGFDSYAADQYYVSPVSVRPMQTVQGTHIGYNEVKVSQTGNGFSVYRYFGSNYWDNRISDVCNRIVDWDNTCDVNIPETPAAPVDVEHMRGELKYEGQYNESGQVVRDVWHYPVFEKSNLLTPGYITTVANNTGVFTYYNLSSYKKISDSTEETTYYPDASANTITVKNVTYRSSKYHSAPTQKVIYNSKGERLVTNYTYAFDLLPSTCATLDNGIATYLNNVHLDSLSYDSTLRDCTPQTGSSMCRYPAVSQFRRNLSLHRISFLTHRMNNYFPTYTSSHNTAKTNAASDYKPVLELQDQYWNAIVESSQWKNNLLIDANRTGYAYSTNPSGEVYPTLTQDIPVFSPTSTFTKAVVNGANTAITKDSRYVNNTTYQFDLGNIVEFTGRDGVTTAYKWAVSNTQPVVKAVGVNYTTLNSAYNAVSGNLTTIRSQPSLSGALLFTYTYEPMIGLTSETSPTLQKLNYEYDALFRLLHVKDLNNNILKRNEYKYQRPKTD